MIGVFSKPDNPLVRAVAPGLLAALRARGREVALDDCTAATLGGEAAAGARVVAADAWSTLELELAIVLGGDGSLLRVARLLRGRDTPLLGVNLGTLGFLTELSAANLLEHLPAILEGRFQRDSRGVLAAEVWREGERLAQFDALNEAVIGKGSLARILHLDLAVDGAPVSHFRADGLIVSTPTGSTAYSLSAGGPVLEPELSAWVVTPICPHTLSNRPLIVREEAVLEVRLRTAAEQTHLTLDGQQGLLLRAGDRVVCRRAPHRVTLVRLPEHSFYAVLRDKLKWE